MVEDELLTPQAGDRGHRQQLAGPDEPSSLEQLVCLLIAKGKVSRNLRQNHGPHLKAQWMMRVSSMYNQIVTRCSNLIIRSSLKYYDIIT